MHAMTGINRCYRWRLSFIKLAERPEGVNLPCPAIVRRALIPRCGQRHIHDRCAAGLYTGYGLGRYGTVAVKPLLL